MIKILILLYFAVLALIGSVISYINFMTMPFLEYYGVLINSGLFCCFAYGGLVGSFRMVRKKNGGYIVLWSVSLLFVLSVLTIVTYVYKMYMLTNGYNTLIQVIRGTVMNNGFIIFNVMIFVLIYIYTRYQEEQNK